MELTDALLAQINAYLSDGMDESERQSFENRIRQDADLQREVILQHELKQGLLLLAEKKRFETMHTDLMQRGLLSPTADADATPADSPNGKVIPFPTRPVTLGLTWNYRTVAASVILLLGIGCLFFWRQTLPLLATIQRDKAFYSVFTPDIKLPPPTPIDPDRLGATLTDPAGQQDSVRLLRGVRLLESQQVQPAISQLLPIAQGLPGHWRAGAQWFLALAYLRNGQINQTDSLLTLIADANGHPYQLEARRLAKLLPHPPANRQ